MAIGTSEIDEIRSRMAQIRRELHEDVRDVVATAEAVTDWHRYIRMYPWAALGLATAIGYVIVPRKRRSVPSDVARKPDLEKVREAVEGSRETKAEKAKESTRKGLLVGAFGLIGPVVLRAAQGYAVRYLEQWIAQMPLPAMAAGPPRAPRRPRAIPPVPAPGRAARRARSGDRAGHRGHLTRSTWRFTPMIDRMQDLESGLGPQADEIKERALEYAAVARERLAEGSEKVKSYVVKEPARALGIALGVGVLLGWLIKRR